MPLPSFVSLIPHSGKTALVRVHLNGAPLDVERGQSVALTVLRANVPAYRTTAVSGASRAPFCMIGNCFDCLVEVNGYPNQQGCLTPVEAGMTIRTSSGRAGVPGREGP